jgi:hypothetical protein
MNGEKKGYSHYFFPFFPSPEPFTGLGVESETEVEDFPKVGYIFKKGSVEGIVLSFSFAI